MQIVAVVAVLLSQFTPGALLAAVRHWSLIGTGALACISGFDYAIKMAWRLSMADPEIPELVD